MNTAAVLSPALVPCAHQKHAARGCKAQRMPAIRARQRAAGGDAPFAARLAGVAAAATLLLTSGGNAWGKELVGEFPTSGFLFKDTVKVIALDDKQVDNVMIYLTDYNRSITERLSKDFFSDPSQASLTCVATGPVIIKDEAAISGSEGKEIFKERKALNFLQNKNLRLRRIYDEKNKALIYVAYSTRNTGATEEKEVSTSRYRTSVCAVPISAAPLLAPVLQEAASETTTATE